MFIAETALLLVFQSLRLGLFERAVYVNYATDLEDQSQERAENFFLNIRCSGNHNDAFEVHDKMNIYAIKSSTDAVTIMSRTLGCHGVLRFAAFRVLAGLAWLAQPSRAWPSLARLA